MFKTDFTISGSDVVLWALLIFLLTTETPADRVRNEIEQSCGIDEIFSVNGRAYSCELIQ